MIEPFTRYPEARQLIIQVYQAALDRMENGDRLWILGADAQLHRLSEQLDPSSPTRQQEIVGLYDALLPELIDTVETSRRVGEYVDAWETVLAITAFHRACAIGDAELADRYWQGLRETHALYGVASTPAN